MLSGTRRTKALKTQWAAQFLAAAELARQGYLVAFTMGNHTPMADLMVGHLESGDQFWVDVKGLSATGAWLLGEKADLPNLFYILVRVAEKRENDRFFILTQMEAKHLIGEYWTAHPNQTPTAALAGFNWGAVLDHENRWDKLPGFQKAAN